MNETIPVGLCQCGCGGKTAIATKNCAATNRIKGHPMQYIRGHNALNPPIDPTAGIHYAIEDRGYDSECWVWLGTMTHGYAIITVLGKRMRAHKYVYEYLHGPIPPDSVGHHKCPTKNCVRPDHVKWITQSEHMLIHTLEDEEFRQNRGWPPIASKTRP